MYYNSVVFTCIIGHYEGGLIKAGWGVVHASIRRRVWGNEPYSQHDVMTLEKLFEPDRA